MRLARYVLTSDGQIWIAIQGILGFDSVLGIWFATSKAAIWFDLKKVRDSILYLASSDLNDKPTVRKFYILLHRKASYTEVSYQSFTHPP